LVVASTIWVSHERDRLKRRHAVTAPRRHRLASGITAIRILGPKTAIPGIGVGTCVRAESEDAEADARIAADPMPRLLPMTTSMNCPK
jgi:hypothetical protein